MNRRDFLRKLSKFMGGGVLSISLQGCKPLHDFYSFDGSMTNGKTWTNHQNTGVAGKGPTVIKDGNSYKMWYHNNASTQIEYRTSSDGINWSAATLCFTNAATPTTWDASNLTNPSVIKVHSTYKMWYQGNSGGGAKTIYCESTDGINWSNFINSINIGQTIPGYPVTTKANAPSVIYDNGTYKIWLGGYIFTATDIIYAESSDGYNWNNFQMSLPKNSFAPYDTNSALAPFVMRDGNRYKMWYQGFDATSVRRIIYCDSSDGFKWSNFYDSVDKSPSTVMQPTVMNVEGLGKMWYTNGSTGTIWYAESR